MVQQLQLRDQFQSVLKNYQVNEDAVKLLNKTSMVLMAGLSGSGRNTIIGLLEATGKYRFVKSDTTRAPRINHGVLEEDGGPYWFKTEAEFLEGLKQGNYLEAAIIHNQQVSGLSIKEIEVANREGKIAITEVTPEGIDTYSRLKPGICCIFMLPPSTKEWMHRLATRGHMTTNELRRRQTSALAEINDLIGSEKYKAVVNTDLEDTFNQVREIIEGGMYSQDAQSYGLAVARDLKSALEIELHSSPH